MRSVTHNRLINKCLNILSIPGWLIPGILFLLNPGSLLSQTVTQTFNSTGSFVVPAGVNSVTVECWGAGGAGGGNTTTSDGGGGGGGGAYSRSVVSVSFGINPTVTVGTGGTGSTGNGTAGGDTWFGSTSTILAKGGAGGSAPVSGGGGIGGAGGSTGSIGVTVFNGGNGGTGRNSSTGRGGPGGSSAGTAANGTSGTTVWSVLAAGTPPAGGGIGGDGGAAGQNGLAGTVPGGAGGGSGDGNRSGGDGADGMVIVTWTAPVFYSRASGDPTDPSNWETVSGDSPANFITNNQTFIIQSGHTMTTTVSGWSVSGNNTKLIIRSGGVLTETTAITISANTTFQVEDGATFNHNVNSVTAFGGTENFAASSTVSYGFTGNQTVVAGTYGNLILSGSNQKTITTATTTVNGIFSREGTATASNAPTYGASATLRYQGSGLQMTGPEASGTFSGSGGVIVNNPSGLALSANLTISSALTMNQGNINTGSFILIITSSSPGAVNRISGNIIGKIRRAVNTSSANYTFPVGTASDYRPATFNFSAIASATNITAEFISTSPAGFVSYIDGVSTLNDLFTEGYWRFYSSGTPVVNYSLSLSGNGFTSYEINDASRITYRDNANATWRKQGQHGIVSDPLISRTGITVLNTTSFDFAFASGCVPTSMGFAYERDITLDYTKVAGGSDLFNFPVLISLSGQNFLKTEPSGRITNSSGYDISFTDGSYNKLDHQVEYYNGTNGDLMVWVRIPTLSHTSNTIIKILYGNSQVTTDPSVTTVWDSHYRGVWHLDNNSLADFTSVQKSGTSFNSPTFLTGKIDSAIALNGSDQYIEIINDPDINFAGNITISGWVYMTTGGRDQKIAGNQNNSSGGFKFGIYTNNKVEFEIRNAANTASLNRDVTGGTILGTGQWYYLAGMSSDVLDSIKTFVNGISERPYRKTGILGIASDNLIIGKEPFLSDYYFRGRFDELRISNKVRSDGWLRTEYNNQSSPSGFCTVGPESANNNLPSESICNGPIILNFGFPRGGVYTGNTYITNDSIFSPPSAGTFTISYTYTSTCGSTSISKNFIITDKPSAPVAPDQSYCASQITYLQATSGENIKWYFGGKLVSTANPFSTGKTVPGTYTYKATQTVNGCEGDSAVVILTISNSVSIATQPQPAIICQGNNATFTVIVTGPTPSYQWQENGVNITNGGIYSGAKSSTLILTNPDLLTGKLYRCVITNTCAAGSITSSEVALTVNPLPLATFSYPGTPFCPNAGNISPLLVPGGSAGVFSSSSGLVFISTASGQVNTAASTPGVYSVTNTIAASGGCAEVTATSPFAIVTDYTWTGAGTSWNTAANWSCNILPGATNSVIILNVPNKPVLAAGSPGAVNNLTIDAGSSLTIDGNTLKVAGTITNNGIFDAGNGKIELNGIAPQVIGSGVFKGDSIMDITINNGAGVSLLDTLKVTNSLLLQNGNFASGGNLIIGSTAAKTAYIDGSGTGNVTGSVTMERYLPSAFGYRYISSPFQAAAVSQLSDELAAPGTLLYAYNENRIVSGFPVSGWYNYKVPANPLVPLTGYSLNFGTSKTPLTFDVSGVVNNGNVTINLYNNDQDYTKGFNLVGNPYPSAIDWDVEAGWTKNLIDYAIYFFRPGSTDQYGGTYSSYVNGVGTPLDGTAYNIIPSMQGFFVHVTDGDFPVAGSLAVNNLARTGNTGRVFMKRSFSKGSPQVLRVSAEYAGNPVADQLAVYFDEKATDEFDSRLDAIKYLNTDASVPNLYAYSHDGSRLSINALPVPADSFPVIPLGLRTKQNSDVIFRISSIDAGFPSGKTFLYDAYSGSSAELTGSGYSIFLNAGDYPARFFLNFTGITTGAGSDITNKLEFLAWYADGILKADVRSSFSGTATLSLISMTGQKVFEKKIFEKGYHEFGVTLKDGIYIIRFDSDNLRNARKVIIMNR